MHALVRSCATSTLALLLAAVTACGANDAPTAAPTTAPAPQQAVSRTGDVTIRANVLQTSTLDEQVARGYGIDRAEGRLMLLVGVRQGEGMQETALPARITATATDLRGRRHPIEMRELRSGDLLDYVGTFEASLPDTLRFDLEIVRADGARSTMQFSRDLQPR